MKNVALDLCTRRNSRYCLTICGTRGAKRSPPGIIVRMSSRSMLKRKVGAGVVKAGSGEGWPPADSGLGAGLETDEHAVDAPLGPEVPAMEAGEAGAGQTVDDLLVGQVIGFALDHAALGIDIDAAAEKLVVEPHDVVHPG